MLFRSGHLKPCEGCCRANARAKAVRKSTNVRATKPGERLFVDTSGPYPESLSVTVTGYRLLMTLAEKAGPSSENQRWISLK